MLRSQPWSSPAPVHVVCDGQVKPSSHGTGSQMPLAGHRIPSVHDDSVHAGWQRLDRGEPAKQQLPRYSAQTSASAQSVPDSQRRSSSHGMPHPDGDPGGTQDSLIVSSQSVSERQS